MCMPSGLRGVRRSSGSRTTSPLAAIRGCVEPRNVVNMSVKALVASEKALDAEVLAAIKTGLKVLELEADQAGELMHHLSAEQKQEARV